jgi:(R,R)-butanediol dehydrogenase/meso-butanediol dehydrogenase/diacetyl reductase
MRAAVFLGPGRPLSVETLPDPEPGPADVVIRMHRCGVCGTDLHMTAGHGWGFTPGSVLGHEYAGEVVEVGKDVATLKKGDLITAMSAQGCGRCVACAHGNFSLCPTQRSVMGGFGEYLRVPEEVAVKAPAGLSAADTALVEPFAIGLYGVRQARIRPDDRVLVLGGGSVALAVAWWAKRLGAGRVVAVSRSQTRAAMLRAMGADAFVQSGETEVAEVAEALGGAPDIVYECVGAPGLLGEALDHVRPFGQIVSMGFCTAPDAVIPALAGSKAVSFAFPVGHTLADFRHVADLMAAGVLDAKPLVTSVVSLDAFPAAFEALRGPNAQTKLHLSLV